MPKLEAPNGESRAGPLGPPPLTIPAVGETIAGKYVVESECGRGGLAVVLSAWHAELGRRVAIKVLLPKWSSDKHIVDRFLREGSAATSIQSQHCVKIFDVGTLESGAAFLVLEHLEGQNLDDVLSGGPLAVPTAIDWLLQATEAIAEGHAHGIVHRDLKPANLFLTQLPDGTASIKVIDFGLSKVIRAGTWRDAKDLTQPNDVMGSPSYMAPEQLRASGHVDARTDQWALGAVLFELITAQSPFGNGNIPETCAAVLLQAPAAIASLQKGVPVAVERADMRCLEKDPDARFGNVAELAAALAPYGSASARKSCECIERVLGVAATPAADPDPADAYAGRGRLSSPASRKVVLRSFLMLGGLALVVFAGLCASVHSHAHDWAHGNIQSLLRLVSAPGHPPDSSR